MQASTDSSRVWSATPKREPSEFAIASKRYPYPNGEKKGIQNSTAQCGTASLPF